MNKWEFRQIQKQYPVQHFSVLQYQLNSDHVNVRIFSNTDEHNVLPKSNTCFTEQKQL